MKKLWPIAGVLLSSFLLAGFASPGDAFNARVKQYLQLHRKLAKELAPLKMTGTPADIETHQKAFTAKIRAARPNARQGEIFTPEVSKEFRQMVRAALAAAGAQHIRASLQNAEPVHGSLQVNDSYPAGVPLQSTPPSLLRNFPRLPEELDYRIVGRSLVLRDTIANVVVDFIPDLLPGPTGPK